MERSLHYDTLARIPTTKHTIQHADSIVNAVHELPHGDVWVTEPDDVTVYLDLVGKAVAVGADWR